MNVNVTIRAVDRGPGLRRWIEERLRAALASFDPEVLYASLAHSDENGSKGGIDQRCTLTIRTRRLGALSFESQHAEVHPAVVAVARRARRALRRRLALRLERVRRSGSTV